MKNFKFYVLNVPPILRKRGDTIQGRTLYKGGHYLRKYGIWDFQGFENSKKNISVKTILGNTVYYKLESTFCSIVPFVLVLSSRADIFRKHISNWMMRFRSSIFDGNIQLTDSYCLENVHKQHFLNIGQFVRPFYPFLSLFDNLHITEKLKVVY